MGFNVLAIGSNMEILDLTITLGDIGLVTIGAIIRPYLSKLASGVSNRIGSYLLSLLGYWTRRRVETANETVQIANKLEEYTFQVVRIVRQPNSTINLSDTIENVVTVAESLPDSVDNRDEIIEQAETLLQIQEEREDNSDNVPRILTRELINKTFELQMDARELKGESDSILLKVLRYLVIPKEES